MDDGKKKKPSGFVPIRDIIPQLLAELEKRIVPQSEWGELYEVVDLPNARGLRIEGKTAVVHVGDETEARIALGENFPLVVRNYGGTTRSKNGAFFPGCILYVQDLEKAKRIKQLAPQGIIPRKGGFPHHITFRYRSWTDLLWLIQRFMREQSF